MRIGVGLVVLAAVAAGCALSPASSVPPPKCAVVWVKGQVLPKTYTQCNNSTDHGAPAGTTHCTSAAGVTHVEYMYTRGYETLLGIAGGRIYDDLPPTAPYFAEKYFITHVQVPNCHPV